MRWGTTRLRESGAGERAVMLRFAACWRYRTQAALLIAALSAYTTSRIAGHSISMPR